MGVGIWFGTRGSEVQNPLSPAIPIFWLFERSGQRAFYMKDKDLCHLHGSSDRHEFQSCGETQCNSAGLCNPERVCGRFDRNRFVPIYSYSGSSSDGIGTERESWI